MKATNFPKWASLQVLVLAALLFSCKKTEVANENPKVKSSKTIKEIIFSGSLDVSNGISQISIDKDIQRVLIPIKTPNSKLHKYYLSENNIKQKQIKNTYVISKVPINSKDDLFAIKFDKTGVSAYTPTSNKNGYSAKLLLKNNDKEINLNSTFIESNPTSNFVNPVEGEGGYCIDHWWVEYNWETGDIISIDFLGSTCYGCMITNTCGGGGGGGGGATQVDSLALLANVSEEYNGIHDGDFNMRTDNFVHVPLSATSTSPFTKTIDWPVVNAEYYKVDAKTVTKSYCKPAIPTIGQQIEVTECKSVGTLFSMKKTSWFWKVKWEQASIPDGEITYVSGTPYAFAMCEANGYIHIEARSGWWEIMNAMPTITASSDLSIHYRHAPVPQ